MIFRPESATTKTELCRHSNACVDPVWKISATGAEKDSQYKSEIAFMVKNK